MTNKNNNQNFQNLLNKASEQLGVDPDTLKSSAENGNLSQTLKNLNPDDAEKIQKVLSDKNAAEKILSTPKAQALLKKFLGEN